MKNHTTRPEFDTSPRACARRRAAVGRIADSPGNRSVRRVAALLRELVAVAGDFGRDHPARCRCPFCRASDELADIPEIKRDMRGIAWMAERLLSIQFETPRTPEEEEHYRAVEYPRMMAEFVEEMEARGDG